MINKNSYKTIYASLCASTPEISLFSKNWWLDAVCEIGQWDVCLAFNKEGDVIGAMPYYLSRQFGMKVIKRPMLSPFFNIWLKYPENQVKRYQKYAFEKVVVGDLIDQLPKVYFFSQRYDYSFTNWLPFYYRHFQQSTFYSYRIEDLSDLGAVFAGFKPNIRNKIRKAEKVVDIQEIDDIELFYSINQLSFHRQKHSIPYSLAFLRKLDDLLRKKGQRKIYLARDQKNRNHAAIYIVWDEKSAYYLASGADTSLRSSGAVQLLIWKAIQDASKIVNYFDFEGSMIPNIESMFCDFGGIHKPYFRIRRAGNPWIAGLKGFFDNKLVRRNLFR